MKKIITSLIMLFVFITISKAQSFENILAAGKEDASIYLGKYMEPIYKGLIYDLNSGWYHSGKTHKKYGFDITISANASFVPQDEKVFRFNNADYAFLELESGLLSDDLPTVMGQTSDKRISVRIPLDVAGNIIPVGSSQIPFNYRVISFETLDGIEEEMPIAAVPTAMIQVGVGLPSKTDIKLRYVPTIDANEDITFNLFGIGLQHNLLQHFKLDKTHFDLSVLGAFTTSTTKYTPKDSSISVNQETTIKVNAYTAQLVGNFDLKIINFYAGLGYTAGTVSTQVKGDYSYTYNLTGGGTYSETIHDPIDIDFNLSGVKATVGMRLNIAWFKIFADYTLQEYNTANVGIAFSLK